MKDANTKQPAATWQGAFQVFGDAFRQIMANPTPAIFFGGVYLIVILLETFAPGPGSKDSFLRTSTYETPVYLLFLLALPVYGLAIADRKSISLRRFMQFDAKKYLWVLVATLLYGVIVAGSMLLLIVPAIWTIAWFSLCIFVVVDTGAGPIEALRESKRLVQNHKGKVWGIIGVTILGMIVSSIVGLTPTVGQPIANFLSTMLTVVSTGATAILFRWAQNAAKAQ